MNSIQGTEDPMNPGRLLSSFIVPNSYSELHGRSTRSSQSRQFRRRVGKKNIRDSGPKSIILSAQGKSELKGRDLPHFLSS